MFERPDPELDAALDLSKSDPQQAAQVLRIAASYLKRQENLPSALAFFLSDAFESAMRKPTTSRGSELLLKLNLVVAHRRPKANFEYVGKELEQLLREKVPKGKAIVQVEQTFGLSESRVKSMHRQYLALKASQAEEDQLLCEAEQRHYARQSVSANQKEVDESFKGSKEYPSSELDKK